MAHKMTTKRATPKKQRLEAMPETCGSCRHGHDVTGQVFLLCYGPPPQPVADLEGGVNWHRGGAVEPDEPACHIFSPRNRA